ncbi:spore coat U domain-containing protein [Paraburkholderia sp. MMS20-SJTN17]|uniref:Spore coat U domain-containing protein n=1 Tax=Paraburkholderia translucens TaxID=2886945 RepID=A0ABS8KAU5_9BURK|nr:spore coat U domain-containing protein [Paraburkholderia sp. MMS20-SJTN17]MCC8401573.1 spore coat U domain-containing protein [Paraburkholderia sp. MMS20-SJTN17]
MPIARASPRNPAALMFWLAVFVALALHVQPAHAQSSDSCFVNGAFGMDFGTVTSSGRPATSQLNITCEPDFSGGQTFHYQVCIYLNPGQWSGGQPTRRMSNYNNAYLNYDLFSDPVHTQHIGAPGSTPVYQVQIVAAPATPQTVNIPIYGWVYPGQAVPAAIPFSEQGITGLLRFRYSTASFASSADCTTGGIGGGISMFNSSGVLATFEYGCWVAATDIDFGAVPPPLSQLRETGNIRVECPPGTTWSVGLDNGLNFDGSMRRMAGTGGFVRYQLYQDSSATQVWGNDDASMVQGTTDTAGNTVSLTVYGLVPAQPDLAVGDYVDTIVVTLYY